MAEPAVTPRAALVTGAGRRIGRAIALDLAKAGWAVAVHHRPGSASDADAVVAEILAAGGRAMAVAADLEHEAETEALVPAAVRALGPLGLLVNNASVFEEDDVASATRASWDRHLETNLRAPLVLTQSFARALPAGNSGQVINILDQRVLNLTPHFLSYTVSKSALWTLTRTLAQALAPFIRVNGIGPGPTLPNPRQSDATFVEQWQSVPLQRPVPLADVCAAVRFLIEAESATGQIIVLDGGEHLGWSFPPAGFTPTG
jgi:NAD(P)-dependent dehydrogenase (short-subunit alcohol dehydrogenase family)